MTHDRSEVLRGLKDATPVLLAVAPYAMVLGALASRAGISLVEVMTMTGLNFAGGSEFAAVHLWAVTPPILTIVLLTFLINSRHIVMGAAIAPHMQGVCRRKLLPALFFMADEGWAISYADTMKRARSGIEPAFSWPYYWAACTPFYPVWVGFAVLGALIAPHVGNIEAYGLAIAFPTVFLVLLRSMWQGVRFARPWVVSLVVAALTHLAVPGAWYVLAGTLSGMVSAWFWARKS